MRFPKRRLNEAITSSNSKILDFSCYFLIVCMNVSKLACRIRRSAKSAGRTVLGSKPGWGKSFFFQKRSDRLLGAHPAPYSIGALFLPVVKRWCMNLTFNLHLLLRLKNEWICTTAPSILCQGLDKETILRAHFNNSNPKIFRFFKTNSCGFLCVLL